MIPESPEPEHKPFDSVLRWLVESRTQGGRAAYLVDLGANKGWGLCSCTHFEKKVAPKIRKGEVQNLRYCWHVPEARKRMADWVIYTERRHDKNEQDES